MSAFVIENHRKRGANRPAPPPLLLPIAQYMAAFWYHRPNNKKSAVLVSR
jgi:hypothetical protein